MGMCATLKRTQETQEEIERGERGGGKVHGAFMSLISTKLKKIDIFRVQLKFAKSASKVDICRELPPFTVSYLIWPISH